MSRFVGRRLVAAVAVLFGALTLSFVVLNVMPGDPTVAYSGGQALTPEQQAAVRTKLGVDQPLIERYATFLEHTVTGRLGTSTRTDEAVVDRIGAQLPATVELALAATTLAVVLGVSGGIASAFTRRPWLDRLMSTAWLTGLSMPTFWLGLLLITVVAFGLHLVPATGAGTPQQLILPALTLALAPAAMIAQLVRDGLNRAEREPYTVTARAKGLSRYQVLTRHSLRNALLPVLTIAGLVLGTTLTTAVVVENVFARPGLGRLLLGAIQDHDLPVVQGIVLLIAVAYIVINLLVELLYAWVDPRVRDGMVHR